MQDVKMDLVGKMKDSGLYSDDYIYKEILNFSN